MPSHQAPNNQVGRVSHPVFMGVQWAFTAVAFLFILFRLGVRLNLHRQFHTDDVLVILAWLIFLTTTIIWQVKSPTLYRFYDIQKGKGQWTPDFFKEYNDYMICIAPLTILFYSGLFCIKLSFLFFFYKLGSKIRSHRIWWWVVLFATTAVWAASVADIDYKCSLGGLDFILKRCPSLDHVHYQNRTFYANCAGDVVTDLMILSIPVLILWRTRISIRKKIILIGVFSVTVLVMTIAIIRVAVNTSPDQNTDVSWLYFWSYIEMGTAILVACVASFRQLFVTAQNQHLYGITPPRGSGGLSFKWSNWSLLRSRSQPAVARSWKRQFSRATGSGDRSIRKNGDVLIVPQDYEFGDRYRCDEADAVSLRAISNERERREREHV